MFERRVRTRKRKEVNFIVYDIEATCWQGNHNNTQEVIELGALKLTQYGEVDSIFSTFVRPEIHPRLSPFCTELTSIRQVDVNRADKYPLVIEEFQDWIEVFDEDYLLCSWGNFDKKILIANCKYHDMDYDWVNHHINVKQQYHEIKRLRRAMGLKRVVEKEGFEFTGTAHRGIDDAKNLAKVFYKYLDEWMY